jgi:hypothetical protein
MRSNKVLSFRSPRGGQDRVRARSKPLPIICVGRESGILRSRLHVIQESSDLAVSSISPEEADRWVQRGESRLWVFCPSVELPRLVYVACRVLRFSPQSRLILLEGAQRIGFERSLFHLVIRQAEGTDAFMDALTRLANAA